MVFALIVACGGCKSTLLKGKSPLEPSVMRPNSVVLDIFFVRVPLGDVAVNETLWQQVDEQHFPPALRQRMRQNGFRIGLLGGSIPMTLSKLLELEDKPVASGEANQINVADMHSEPRVLLRHMQLGTGCRGLIVTSGIYDRLPVLSLESGQLGGQTYDQAQAHLSVEVAIQDDGLVQLKLTPELHHGQARLQPRPIAGNEAMFQLTSSRPRRVFDDLSFSASVSPGSMVLVSSLPDRPGSLGHHFLTSDNGRPEQKLLVVRLSQTQHNDVFDQSEVLPLPE